MYAVHIFFTCITCINLLFSRQVRSKIVRELFSNRDFHEIDTVKLGWWIMNIRNLFCGVLSFMRTFARFSISRRQSEKFCVHDRDLRMCVCMCPQRIAGISIYLNIRITCSNNSNVFIFGLYLSGSHSQSHSSRIKIA